MGVLSGMALPALVIGLIVLGVIELASGRRDNRRTSASVGFEALEVLFAPAKHYEVEERQSRSIMRDEEHSGDRPFSVIDLERGTAHLVIRGK